MTGASPASQLSCDGERFVYAARSHVGCVRRCNEDRFLVRGEASLCAVADGMGGHDAGDVASALVIESLTDIVPTRSSAAGIAMIELHLQRVNAELQARGERQRGIMGSTIVALLENADEYACVWAGDSRCYLRRDGALTQISRDHSLVQELIEEGRLAAREARSHPRANVITRAVGAAPELVLERRRGKVRAGDVFLLCSDGLSSTLDDREINEVLASSSAEAAADRLMNLALARGAPDNVTVVIAARR